MTDRHIQANSEYQRLQEELAKSTNKMVEVAVVTGQKHYKDKRTNRDRRKKSVKLEDPGPSGIEDVPFISAPDEASLLSSNQPTAVELLRDEVSQMLQNQSDEIDDVSARGLSPPGSNTGTPVPESESKPSTSGIQVPDSKCM